MCYGAANRSLERIGRPLRKVTIAYFNNGPVECATAVVVCLLFYATTVVGVLAHKESQRVFPKEIRDNAEQGSRQARCAMRMLMWLIWIAVMSFFSIIPAVFVMIQSLPPEQDANTLGLPLNESFLTEAASTQELLQSLIGVLLGYLNCSLMPSLAQKLHLLLIDSKKKHSSEVMCLSIVSGKHITSELCSYGTAYFLKPPWQALYS